MATSRRARSPGSVGRRARTSSAAMRTISPASVARSRPNGPGGFALAAASLDVGVPPESVARRRGRGVPAVEIDEPPGERRRPRRHFDVRPLEAREKVTVPDGRVGGRRQPREGARDTAADAARELHPAEASAVARREDDERPDRVVEVRRGHRKRRALGRRQRPRTLEVPDSGLVQAECREREHRRRRCCAYAAAPALDGRRKRDEPQEHDHRSHPSVTRSVHRGHRILLDGSDRAAGPRVPRIDRA